MHKQVDNQGWKTYLTLKKKRYARNDPFLSNDADIIRTIPGSRFPFPILKIAVTKISAIPFATPKNDFKKLN